MPKQNDVNNLERGIAKHLENPAYTVVCQDTYVS